MHAKMSRRTVLQRAAGLAGAGAACALAGSTVFSPFAVARDRGSTRPSRTGPGRIAVGERSANGWQTESRADAGGAIWTRPVPGSEVTVAVRIGDVEAVLVHVLRRFHYEVATLGRGHLVSHLPPSLVHPSAPESNHASGTAVAIRPDAYPPGIRGGFLPREVSVIRDIIEECDGAVRWGADDAEPYEAQFYLGVPPDDAGLAGLVSRIRRWADTPGKGAGVLHDV